MGVGLITEFGKKNSYKALICELSQVRQEVLEKVKDYTDIVQGLFVRITRNLRA